MTVAFRVDSSIAIGSGHFARCLTLAEALRGLGERVVFVSRRLPGSMHASAENSGFEVLLLPTDEAATPEPGATAHAAWLPATRAQDAEQTAAALLAAGHDADWVVVDSYALDEVWERRVRAALGCRIAVVDDLADRTHDCDVLLDTACADGLRDRYQALCPADCAFLIGPAHAVLRREFVRARRAVQPRTSLRRVLVFFGGSDPDDATAAALHAAAAANDALEVDVVWGGSYGGSAGLHDRFGDMPGVRLIGPTDRMAELMAGADLALGGGGVATWERCFLGLPTIVATLADNQVSNVRCLTAHGAAVAIPRGLHAQPGAWETALESVLSEPARLGEMSRSASGLTADAADARSHALVRAIRRERRTPAALALRRLERKDLELVLRWRNAPEVRQHMTTRHEITAQEHASWFDRLSQADDAAAWVFEVAGVPSGLFQLRGIDSDAAKAEWGFYLSPDAMGRGLGSALCFLGVEAVFDELGLDAIDAQVLDGNTRSLALHELFGFRPGGSLAAEEGATMMELTWDAWNAHRAQVARTAFGGGRS